MVDGTRVIKSNFFQILGHCAIPIFVSFLHHAIVWKELLLPSKYQIELFFQYVVVHVGNNDKYKQYKPKMLIFFSEKKVTLDLWSFFSSNPFTLKQVQYTYIYYYWTGYITSVIGKDKKRVVLIFYWPLIQFYDNCNPALKKLNCSIKSLEHS